MRRFDILFLLAFGLIFWVLGTIYYAFRGPKVLESGPAAYWINFFLTPLLTSLVCIAVLNVRQLPPSAWASAMLLIAIPGMVGEAVVLTHLSTFMPRIQASSGAPYGALLFATYAVTLGIAEIITLKASLQ
jgi:hypothetical protein